MLVWLFGWLGQYYTPFTAVSSLTLRALLAVITALGFSLLFGGRVIRHLRTLKYGQAIRNDGPQSHLVKTGTPTMGGVDFDLHWCVYLVMGTFKQSLRLDFAGSDGHLWSGWLG